MNRVPPSISSNVGWLPHLQSPLLISPDTFRWPPVLDYATNTPSPFSAFPPFPSSSTSTQRVVPPITDLTMYSTLGELFKTLLDTEKPTREHKLSEENIQTATTWISNRFKTVDDIPKNVFDRYADKWRGMADDIAKARESSDATKVDTKQKIPRPCNSFFFFKVVAMGSLHTGIASQVWRALPKKSIEIWKLGARKMEKLHKDIFPEYRFRPRHDLVKRKAKLRRTQVRAEIYEDSLHDERKKWTPETSATTTRGNSEVPKHSEAATYWPKNVDEIHGHGFELPGGSTQYELGQHLPPSTFNLFPEYRLGSSNSYVTGTPLGGAHDLHSRGADFNAESLISEIDDFLRQVSR